MKNTKAIITLRVSYSDWRKIRALFPAEVDETVIHYFGRFRAYMQKLQYEGELK